MNILQHVENYELPASNSAWLIIPNRGHARSGLLGPSMVHVWSAATDIEWTCVIPVTLYHIQNLWPAMMPIFYVSEFRLKEPGNFVSPVFFCQKDPEELKAKYHNRIGQRKQKGK